MTCNWKAELARRLEEIWWHRTPPAWLRALSYPYRLASRLHLALRAKRKQSAPIPVISVGNITVGGSGKTPFCAWLAEHCQQRGLKAAILSRGRCQHPFLVHPDAHPDEVGDEPLMLAKRGHLVIAGHDRIAGCRLAVEEGADLAILDDGMQYFKLARAIDIALVPAEGLGNGHLLPAGPLREPAAALARADLIVRTGTDPLRPIPDVPRPVFRFRTIADQVRTVDGQLLNPHQPVVAVAAIARSERFFSTLAELGFRLAHRFAFADHHRYDAQDIEHLVRFGLAVVTTEKDAAKLAPFWPAHAPPLALLALRPQPDATLVRAIDAMIDASIAPSANEGEGHDR